MMDRRNYPRLHAKLFWRATGRWAPCAVVDASLGGMRVYSDDLVPVGAQLALQVLPPGQTPIDLHARVVRVGILPPTWPAFCDVALQFVDMPAEARRRLAECLPADASEPRVHEDHGDEIGRLEHQHEE